jgi:hypothetical protein
VFGDCEGALRNCEWVRTRKEAVITGFATPDVLLNR